MPSAMTEADIMMCNPAKPKRPGKPYAAKGQGAILVCKAGEDGWKRRKEPFMVKCIRVKYHNPLVYWFIKSMWIY